MATTIIKSSDTDDQAKVRNGRLLVSDDGSSANASVGPNGDPAPTSATEIAGIDPNGDLRPVSVDINGFVNVQGVSTITGPVETTEAGLDSFQTSQYAVNMTVVQLTPTPLAGRSSISLRIEADPNVAVYIGASNTVTIGTGYPLYDGDTLQMDLTDQKTIFAISNGTGSIVAALEIA